MNWSRKNIALSTLLALPVTGLITIIFFSVIPLHHEQDECSFESVTNAEYRGMLSAARSLRWKSIFERQKIEDALLAQFIQVSKNSSSPYIKIAAMHAVLRAWGGEFTNINERQFGDSRDQFEKASRVGGGISFNYAVVVPQIGVPSLPGKAWFIGALNGPLSSTTTADPKRYRPGRLYFVVWLPNPVDPIPSHVLGKQWPQSNGYRTTPRDREDNRHQT